MTLNQLAAALKRGDITIAEWEAGMREYLRKQYEKSLILANGGRKQVTQAGWDMVNQQLKEQYKFLRNFAKDIKKDPIKWSTAALNNRMKLYKDSARVAYTNYMRLEAMDQGYTEERRTLGAADHCQDCLDNAAKSRKWVPIGTLPPIGQSACIVHCHCSNEYRKREGRRYMYA